MGEHGPADSTTARSMMFSSSRMFSGKSVTLGCASVWVAMPCTAFPVFRAERASKYNRERSGYRRDRSRRGGTRNGTTFRR